MAGRKIRDEGDARRCIAAAKAAGLSRTQWARQHGIDGRSLFAWARKTGHNKKRGGLVELIPKASHDESRYVIRCGQIAIEIDECFDEATLVRLLRVVTAC